MKKIKLFLYIVVIFLVFVSSTYAYPIIIIEQNINHTQAKQLIYSVPEKYYKHVNSIEFKDTAYNIRGYANAKWNNKHICYSTYIWIFRINFQILQHELGHIYEFCELKKDVSTEEFANNFKIEK